MRINVAKWRWCPCPAPQSPVCPIWEQDGAEGASAAPNMGRKKIAFLAFLQQNKCPLFSAQNSDFKKEKKMLARCKVSGHSTGEKRSLEHLRNARGARRGFGSRSDRSQAWPCKNKGPIRSQWAVTPRALRGLLAAVPSCTRLPRGQDGLRACSPRRGSPPGAGGAGTVRSRMAGLGSGECECRLLLMPGWKSGERRS